MTLVVEAQRTAVSRQALAPVKPAVLSALEIRGRADILAYSGILMHEQWQMIRLDPLTLLTRYNEHNYPSSVFSETIASRGEGSRAVLGKQTQTPADQHYRQN